MNAIEFARNIAEKTHKDEKTVLGFDRALAVGGARESVARGRHAPDITTTEANRLLLALLSGGPAKLATDNAMDLERFTLLAGQTEDELKAFHYVFGLENDFSRLKDKSLGELLVLLCHRLADGKIGEDNFVFLEVKDGALVTLQCELNWLPDDRSQRLGLTGEIHFCGVTSIRGSGFYYESRVATGSLLRWIGEVTKES